jgi:Holliday junction resolvase
MPDFKTWKDELRFLRLENQRAKYPSAFIASGGYDQKVKSYPDTNTNGLTRNIIDFLTFKGHYAIRTNRQGQARVEYIPQGGTAANQLTGKGVKYNQKVSWTKNPEGKAFTDIQASIDGLYVAIEVKCKTTKDRIKDDQVENKGYVEKSGAIHIIATDMSMFWNWYYNELPIIKQNKLKQ